MPATNPGTTGLAAWYSGDDSGNLGADSHSTNHLTAVNSPSSAAGKVGNGIDLESSSNQYLTIPAASQTGLGSAASFAFGAWCKIESAGTYWIASKRDSGAAEFTIASIMAATSDLWFFLAPNFGAPIMISSVFPVGSWVFVVVGYNSATGKACVSVNGATPTLSTLTYGGLKSAPFSIGTDLSGGLSRWDGMIDEAFYYTRWLTDDELSWLYNSGSGRAYADLVPASGPGSETIAIPGLGIRIY